MSYGNLLMIKASSNGFVVKEEKVQLCAKSGLLFSLMSQVFFFVFLVSLHQFSSRETCLYRSLILMSGDLAVMLWQLQI